MSRAPVADPPDGGTTTPAGILERTRVGRPRRRSWPLSRPARFVRTVMWILGIRPALGLFYTVRAVGLERLTELRGPIVFAANHCAHLDNAFILSALPAVRRRRIAIAAATDDIFGPRHLGLPIKGTLAQLLGNAFPFTQRGKKPARIDHLQFLLDQGWSVLIFPEGRLTVCGPMQPFKPGIGLIAVETGVPVVPIRVEVLRPGPWEGGGLLSRGEVEVRFGEPLRGTRGEDALVATKRLEEAVRAL